MEKRIFVYREWIKESSKMKFVCESTSEEILVTPVNYEESKIYGEDTNVEYVDENGDKSKGNQPKFIDVHVWKSDIVFRIDYWDYCCNFYAPVEQREEY